MQIDPSAAKSFMLLCQGKGDLKEILIHPAYRTVFHHGEKIGTSMSIEDVNKALAGEESPFYGLEGVQENLVRIEELLLQIAKEAPSWLPQINHILSFYLPQENSEHLTLYPIIGYDVGIGLENALCLNLNNNIYLQDYREFFCMAVHEGFHALYETIHPLKNLSELHTTEEWRDLFYIMLQNEGYAVFLAWQLRKDLPHIPLNNHPVLKDYQYLAGLDSSLLKDDFLQALTELESLNSSEWETFTSLAFGPHRFTYRIGSLLLQAIEQEHGPSEIRKGVYQKGKEFFNRYKTLLFP